MSGAAAVPLLAPLALVWGGAVLLLEPAASSMVAVWNSSETYAHGYVILPIVAWLVWRRRHVLSDLDPRPDPAALAVVAAAGLLWLAGRLAGALVVEHYALATVLVASVWGLYGRALARALLFPLLYLYFMVPAGDSLIEPMIRFTADFTVGAVRLFGIPVYQEGNFFVLPSGEWSVVEACSGIRYFLSTLVLGWLYAYLTYQTPWKRLAFGLVCVLTPVAANALRATLIVLLGHYSGMTLATGVDHLIYGWIWFGVVILLLFWVGNRWREDPPAPQARHLAGPASRPPWGMAVLALLCLAPFPAYLASLGAPHPAPSPLATWQPPAGWAVAPGTGIDWRPRWRGMDDQRTLTLERDGATVLLHVAWYGAQRQDAELINSRNVLVEEKDPVWRDLLETDRTLSLGGESLRVRQALLHAPGADRRLLVWTWWRIGGADETNSLAGKGRLALGKLSGRGDAGAALLVATPYGDNPAEAEARLLGLLQAARPTLNPILDGSAPQP